MMWFNITIAVPRPTYVFHARFHKPETLQNSTRWISVGTLSVTIDEQRYTLL